MESDSTSDQSASMLNCIPKYNGPRRHSRGVETDSESVLQRSYSTAAGGYGDLETLSIMDSLIGRLSELCEVKPATFVSTPKTLDDRV
jgi:hypothetical protein